ncbi:MAG: hypothetical protein COA63_008280 [Methylophaga sp.]|nr:hypothetical protein [Methylophaga sp.]
MKELKCPHCHETVSIGATVCKGCQAEIEYGTPIFIVLIIFLISVFLGVAASDLGNSYLGWGVGVVVLVSLFVGSEKIFSNRVKFKRIYKT